MINDKAMRRILESTMRGHIMLHGDETEESVINDYFNHPIHVNYTIDDDVNGYLCVTEYDDYVVINFAWHIGKFATLKKMVRLAKGLYKIYTIRQNKPIYYSGKKNLYSNHSITIANKVWQFIS